MFDMRSAGIRAGLLAIIAEDGRFAPYDTALAVQH